MFERRTAVETDTRDAGNGEFDDQHITGLAGWIVTGCTVDGAHYAVGKRFGVEAGSSLSVLIVPEANRVLCHCESFHLKRTPRFLPLPISSRHSRDEAPQATGGRTGRRSCRHT